MKTVAVNGHEFHVYDRGTGPPILFVHGFPLNHSMWQGQLEPLAENRRVIAPDLRGFGGSGVVEDVITMEQFADDLNILLDALGVDRPVTYCGLSMGGYIGWQFLRKYKDRLNALILCDTKAAADTPEGVKNRKDMARKVLRYGPRPAVRTMLPKLVAEKTNAERPHVLEQLKDMIIASHRSSIAAALHGMAQRPDSTDLLAQITLPTQVIVGSEDTLSPPEEMRRMAEAIPGARFAEIPEAGHVAPLEDPPAVNAAIEEFLDDVA